MSAPGQPCAPEGTVHTLALGHCALLLLLPLLYRAIRDRAICGVSCLLLSFLSGPKSCGPVTFVPGFHLGHCTELLSSLICSQTCPLLFAWSLVSQLCCSPQKAHVEKESEARQNSDPEQDGHAPRALRVRHNCRGSSSKSRKGHPPAS